MLEIGNDRVSNVNMWVGSLSHWLVTDDHHTTYKLVPRTGTPLQVWKAQLLTGSLVLSALFFLLDCLGAAGHFFLAVLQACCCHFGPAASASCVRRQGKCEQRRTRRRSLPRNILNTRTENTLDSEHILFSIIMPLPYFQFMSLIHLCLQSF